jgi:signal transduction histidine kinase
VCSARLFPRDGYAVLDVDDDGVGFDPMIVRRGDGLRNLEDRSTAFGGKTSIDSVPAKGTDR